MSNQQPDPSITNHGELGYWPNEYTDIPRCVQIANQNIADLDYALSLCKTKSVVVQAGGHVGLWAKKLAKEFSLVIAFEPDHAHFECMRWNLIDTDNVAIFEGALDKERGEGKSVVDELKFAKEGQEAAKIDLLIVNSSNIAVLKGAHETIMRDHPVVQVLHGRDHEKISDFLMGRGYKNCVHIGRGDVYEFTGIAMASAVGHRHPGW